MNTKILKKIIILFIIVFSTHLYSNAEYVKYEDWKTGEMYSYEVYTFSEMFLAFEDLNSEYESLIEENSSLERTIEEQGEEIRRLEDELVQFKQKKPDTKTEGEKFILSAVGTLGILLAVSLIYNIIKYFCNKIKHKEG